MAKILIVDDSPTEIHQLTKMLGKGGHEVISADTGDRGVAMARSELPDLILVDVVMPGMNGFQVTRKLSKTIETSHIPIVIVSSKDQETDRVWGVRQGAQAYLIKPVKEKVLNKIIANVVS